MPSAEAIAAAFATARELVQSSWMSLSGNRHESFGFCFVTYDERKRGFSFELADDYPSQWHKSQTLLGGVQFNLASGYEIADG